MFRILADSLGNFVLVVSATIVLITVFALVVLYIAHQSAKQRDISKRILIISGAWLFIMLVSSVSIFFMFNNVLNVF